MDAKGSIIPKMADKFKQINKYLEIIESLIKTTLLPPQINIVDMGSGKGYLTFALYDYLKNKQNLNVFVTGIEQRQDLVDYCNQTAKTCGFNNLKFENKSIKDLDQKQIDIVIALHACDTATDDAIAKSRKAH
jgi:2-polyprenyl-3-methyl-5-hydroxy-6-metoxy-1,4-benzoquinol methylase